MKLIMFTMVFLLIGGFFIISNQEIKLSSRTNWDLFLTEYKLWLSNLMDNGKTATGYIIKMEWLPEAKELKDTQPKP